MGVEYLDVKLNRVEIIHKMLRKIESLRKIGNCKWQLMHCCLNLADKTPIIIDSIPKLLIML